jgi:hypothetical protein
MKSNERKPGKRIAKPRRHREKKQDAGDLLSNDLTTLTPQQLSEGVHSHHILALQPVMGNQTVQRILADALAQRAPTQAEPPTAVGYMGLNPKAYKEAQALKRYTKDESIISLDNPDAQAGLDTDGERAAFILHTLKISPLSFFGFLTAWICLEQCDGDFREQMADMMLMFRNAELGKYRLERLILSGHHSGGEMWGDSNDQHSPGYFMPERDLTNLARAFPNAAAQVKDVMFSACNSTEQVELCKRVFPNLQSVWVYAGYSPNVDQGSARHIVHWEKKTRGDRQPVKKDKIGNTAIWTKDKGFLTKFD